MNLSTVKWAQWDKTQSRDLLGLYICVCISLCTIVADNIAQNRPHNFPPYPPDNHHCSDDVYLMEGGNEYDWTVHVWRRCGLMSNYFDHLLTIGYWFSRVIILQIFYGTEWPTRCRCANKKLFSLLLQSAPENSIFNSDFKMIRHFLT